MVSGDIVHGHVVGAFRPRSTSSRFYVVDFGLKEEAMFTSREVSRSTSVGDSLAMPLVALEDDFNEPVFDHERRSQRSAVEAERMSLLTHMNTSDVRLFYGRFTRFNRGGATVKMLGVDAFVPRHHVLALERPVLGTYVPLYLLSLSGEKASSDTRKIDLYPVASSYGGVLLCLANLVGFDSAWKNSGGGTAAERFAYLRLMTRVLQQKNSAIRRLLPRTESDFLRSGRSFHDKPTRRAEPTHGDTAWLNELPRQSWNSSNRDINSSSIARQASLNKLSSRYPLGNASKQQRRRKGDSSTPSTKTGPTY